MSGAANNAIVRRGRWRFNGSRSAVLLAALPRVGGAKKAGAKQPRWQTGKSSTSAIRPRTTTNAPGGNASSSKARENSATYAPIGAKTKVDFRDPARYCRGLGGEVVKGEKRVAILDQALDRTSGTICTRPSWMVSPLGRDADFFSR
jgi:hypothetical protein